MSSPLFLSVSRSHLQPIFPEAPAPQHSAVLAGSHHRPGRCGSLLFLDVEASQAGIPGSPRSHTRKSNSGLHFWFCFRWRNQEELWLFLPRSGEFLVLALVLFDHQGFKQSQPVSLLGSSKVIRVQILTNEEAIVKIHNISLFKPANWQTHVAFCLPEAFFFFGVQMCLFCLPLPTFSRSPP